MSWFDKAKTALKEAQIRIDKALDIQEEAASAAATTTTASPPDTSKLKSSNVADEEPETSKIGKANPTKESSSRSRGTAISTSVSADSATWGSFSGSFFDNPKAHEMVTVPPKATNTAVPTNEAHLNTHIHAATVKRQSVTSNSDSVELLSPPTPATPGSAGDDEEDQLEAASSSAKGGRGNNSDESVELITATSTSEELASPSGTSLHESSIVVISAANKPAKEAEEDSMSNKTLVEDSTSKQIHHHQQQHPDPEIEDSCSKGILPSMDVDTDPNDSTFKLLISMQDVPYEMQSVDSDSTQSFEDVQMQSCVGVPNVAHETEEDHLRPSSEDDKLNLASPPNSNSNDELETTSSDIEIISNPNGDSSSANSTTRPSPSIKTDKAISDQRQTGTTAALSTKKGHYREPSEISVLSEDSQSELDKLLHRIGELNEMLATRDLQKATLQDRNNELQALLEAMKSNTASLDSAEEYTQRLSALEKKFQASIRERDALRIQIRALQDELQSKIPRDNLTQVVAESDAMISELRSEGEKLSKEILLQSNILKKLRAKEKSSEGLLKKNKDQIASMSDELERLKKTLNAKEDVERSQIEAVHKMSSEKRKLEEENAQSRSRIEDLQSKLATMQTSFDAVKVELQQRSRLHSDLTRTTEEALAAKKENEATAEQNQAIMLQLNELREKLRYAEHAMARREQQLREDNKHLLGRLEAAELRAENSKQDVSLTTIPLYRQLEALQNALSQRTSTWHKEEKILLEKLDAAQSQSKCLENMEVTFKEKNDLLQARCIKLEEKLSQSLLQEEKSKIAVHQAQLDYSVKETSQNRLITTLNNTLTECESKIKSLEHLNRSLKESAALKSAVPEGGIPPPNLNPSAEYSQPHFSADLIREDDIQTGDQQQRTHSPVLSFCAQTLEEEMGGSVDWQASDFDCISNPERHGNTLDYGMHLHYMGGGHNATTFEHLQSLLKQREGEVTLLQWEISRLKAERDILNEEISNITMELEITKEKLQSVETVNNSFGDLQHRYDALLQMFGEKVERTEELELDLVELKEAYKTQIDELLAKPPNSTT